jgi:hypothetical protein
MAEHPADAPNPYQRGTQEQHWRRDWYCIKGHGRVNVGHASKASCAYEGVTGLLARETVF